jgi:hypothetical protein
LVYRTTEGRKRANNAPWRTLGFGNSPVSAVLWVDGVSVWEYTASKTDRVSRLVVCDPPSDQVVGSELSENFVSQQGADMVFPHLVRKVDKRPMAILQLHSEHDIRQSLNHRRSLT